MEDYKMIQDSQLFIDKTIEEIVSAPLQKKTIVKRRLNADMFSLTCHSAIYYITFWHYVNQLIQSTKTFS